MILQFSKFLILKNFFSFRKWHYAVSISLWTCMKMSFILFHHVYLVAVFALCNDGFDKTTVYALATAMKVLCTFSNVDPDEWDHGTIIAFMWLRLFFIGSFLPFVAARVWKEMEAVLGTRVLGTRQKRRPAPRGLPLHRHANPFPFKKGGKVSHTETQ